MSEAIIVALITGLLSLAGVIITSIVSNQKIQAEINTAIAVQDAKIDELTREVRQHNNFAQRMPVVENEIKHIKDDIHKYHN